MEIAKEFYATAQGKSDPLAQLFLWCDRSRNH